MAATSSSVQSSVDGDPHGQANMEEFSFAPPSTPDSDLFAGSIETGEEYMESSPKGSGENGSALYSHFFSKKNFQWLLEVDESGDDDEFKKPLLYVPTLPFSFAER